MSLSEISDLLIAPAAKLGIRTLIISGGEPTLRRDIFELLDIATAHGLFIWFASNMLNISQPRLEKLVAHLPAPHVVAVSFDSCVAEQMAVIRGGDFLARVEANSRELIRLRRGQNSRTAATLIVQQDNLSSVIDTVDHVLDDIGFSEVGVYLRHDYHGVTLDNLALQRQAAWIIAHRRELIALGMRLYRRAADDPRVMVRGVLDDWVRFIENPHSIRRPCHAGNTLYFNTEGRMRTCMFGTEVADIRLKSLADIIASPARTRQLELTGTCRICLISCN